MTHPGESIDVCQTEQCSRPVHAKGLCYPCYKRAWRAGNGAAVERERAAARAWKAAHPEAIQRLEESYMGACADCGQPRTRRSTRCQQCEYATRSARYPEIERRWKDGESLKEIAAALGTTVDSLGKTMHRMRELGRDLPYRYRTYAGRQLIA